MRVMHMAFTDHESTDRCNFHVERSDDADRHATWYASPCPSGRVHDFPDRGPRGSFERSSAYVGDLQYCGAEVSVPCLSLECEPLLTFPSSVATGYGQPPSTIYDWALEPASLKDADYHLPENLAIRLRIEKFCDRVTKSLYSSKPEPAEFVSAEKLVIVQILESELKEMELQFGQEISGMIGPPLQILTVRPLCID